MSKRWLGLLLFVFLISRGHAAYAAFTAAPSTVAIGSVAVGASMTGTTMLSNDANVGIQFDLTAAGCGEFTIPAPPASLTSTPVTTTVKLTPTVGGAKSCVIKVINQADSSTLGTFTVTGTATGTPTITVTPGPIAFNHVDVGSISGTQTVTATNMGTDTLSISSAAIVTTPGNYTVSPAGAQSVPPGGHVDYSIACKPQTQGMVDDTFRITSNAAGSPNNVALTCTGDLGKLTVDLTSLTFPQTLLNMTSTLQVVLSNTGNVAVTGLTGTFNVAEGFSVDATTPVPPMLAANSSVTLKINFKPATKDDGSPTALTFAGVWNTTHATTATTAMTGTPVSLSFTKTAIDFGDFLFDAKPTQTFSLTNSGNAAVAITAVTFTGDPGTTDTEVTRTFVLDGTPTSTLSSIPAGKTLDVIARAEPANRMGGVKGKFTVKLTGLPDQTVTVTGNATAAIAAVTPTVDFGLIDVDDPTAHTKMVTITNTGTGPLNIASFTRDPNAAYTITPSGAISIPAGSSQLITITYAPAAASMNPDQIGLTAHFAGVLNGVVMATTMITGRGIDRVFALQPAPGFPPTFRNPGDQAPVRAITVRNQGEAVLKVTAAMITGDPVWQLIDAAPVDIPGGSGHDFMVKFSPTALGPAPTGMLTFTNNDNAKPMATIPLDGSGILRDVAFGPMTGVEPRMIDLGVTGAGVPVTIADVLAVANLDPATTFKIREIKLADTAAFEVASPPDNVELPQGMTKTFAVTFSPSAVGDFTTTATLYLDQDTDEQAEVQLTGHALFVEAHGSGGCDAGGTGGSGGLVLGLAALGVIRRRSRPRVVAS